MSSPSRNTEWYSNNGDPRYYSPWWPTITPISPFSNGIASPSMFGSFEGMSEYSNHGSPCHGSPVYCPGPQTCPATIAGDFRPRYIEDLRAERTYLLNTLRLENEKATALLAQIPPLEGERVEDPAPQMRRKIKKKLGWLRHRLNETNRQEQAIMGRLGQLMEEIQFAECRAQVETNYFHLQGHPESLMYSNQDLHLDPATPIFQPHMTPIFQPQEFPFPYTMPSTNACSSQPDSSEDPTTQSISVVDEVDRPGPNSMTTIQENVTEDGTSRRPSLVVDEGTKMSHQSCSIIFEGNFLDFLTNEGHFGAGRRRHSLPIIRGLPQ